MVFFSLFFFRFDLSLQPIADVLHPQSHEVGRVLLGMSSPIIASERYPSQKSASPVAHFELLTTSQKLIKKIWST